MPKPSRYPSQLGPHTAIDTVIPKALALPTTVEEITVVETMVVETMVAEATVGMANQTMGEPLLAEASTRVTVESPVATMPLPETTMPANLS